MSKRLFLSSLLLIMAACQAEILEPTVFRIAETDPWTDSTRSTRSILSESDIEIRKTCVTIAAYADGTLVAARHYESGLEAMSLDLEPNRDHSIYALVNMGDLTLTIPISESELSELTYRIPSYTEGAGSISSRGLPMVGKLAWPGQGTAIPISRLVAKVTAHLSCEWEGAVIREVRVRNLNRVLRPFGDAVCGEDWDQQEFQEGTCASSGSFVFYVPENLQGSIDGIYSSREKSPDGNSEVAARSNRLTYLETVVEGNGAYVGTITYRSYLGQNATTDFNIRRNARYDWIIRYLEDGLQYDDWKHDNDLTDTQSGLHIDDGWDDGGEEELH